MGTETAKSDLFVLKREAGGEPYKFKVGSKVITIPHVQSVDQFDLADVFEREHRSDLAFMSDMFRFLMGDDFSTLKDLKLSRPELTDLWDRYQAHCGVDSGESPASSD